MAHQTSLFEGMTPGHDHDRHERYARVRDALLDAHPDQGALVRLLALAGIRHQDGDTRRIVIRGPDGASASSLLASLSSALGLVFHSVDSPALAESNWHGTDLTVHFDQLLRRAVAAHGLDVAESLGKHACILIQRLDGIRLVGDYASASTRDHRVGQQASLVPLLAGSDIPVDRSGGFIFSAADALVAVTAELRRLPDGRPDVGDLVSWGMVPELAEILGRAVWIHMRPPTALAIGDEVRRGVRRLESLFVAWGYRLVVADQVLRHVLGAVVGGPYTGGSQVALAWIEAACESGLIRMVEDGAAPGATWVLAVDDLSLPARPKGVWRE